MRKLITFIGVMAVIFILGYLWVTFSGGENTSMVNDPARGVCGIWIEDPFPNGTIHFPYQVRATVDHSPTATKDCTWKVYGNTAASLSVENQLGQKIGFGTLTTTEDPASKDVINYAGNVQLYPSNVGRAIGSIFLVVTEGKPSDEMGAVNSFKMRLESF